MKIISSKIALPGPLRSQADLLRELELSWVGKVTERERSLLARLAKSSGVGSKHLAMEPSEYRSKRDFTARNNVFIDVGRRLACDVISRACADAELSPSELDAIFYTTVTGLSVPSLDAKVAGDLKFKESITRSPFFGLGCVGGAAGIARVHDFLKAWPAKAAVLLSVELCSLTLQLDDLSPESIVASTLFGDGATALICVGAEHPLYQKPGLETLAATARLYPDSSHIMGWDIGTHGFKILLDPGVPRLITDYFADDVKGFLSGHHLGVSDIKHWICHPGGPKVLKAIESSLALPESALRKSWEQLETMGNLSSSSVLAILNATSESLKERFPSGEHALVTAMGPGFCSEQVLCRWS